MDIVVNEELKAYIDPLTADEYEALERSLLAEGCRDALVLWGNVLVDGHNRYSICRKHALAFQTVQATRFQSMEDVHLWMIDQHLGRRSLSDYQRGELALRKREITTQRRERARAATGAAAPEEVAASEPKSPEAPTPAKDDALDTREALARAARLSNSQVLQIEKIQRQAAKEVVEAVKAGTISLSAAATVASLPVEEQVAAAVAGKDELRQAAKRVREARRKRAADTGDEMLEPQEAPPAPGLDEHTVETLRQRVAELVSQNMALHQQVAQLKAQLARHEGAGVDANANENGGDAPPWE